MKNMTLSIEEIPFIDLISLNPLRVKNSKYDQLICLVIQTFHAFQTEASKLKESEITTTSTRCWVSRLIST